MLACHGLEELGDKLSKLASAGKWDEMPGEIDEQVLRTSAIVGTAGELGTLVAERWGGLVDGYAVGTVPDELLGKPDKLRAAVEAIRAA